MSTVAAHIDEPSLIAPDPQSGRLAGLIASHFRRGPEGTRDLTPVLACYWLELPRRPSAARAQLFQQVRARVRLGELSESACVPFVLGDPSTEVVMAATTEYIGARPLSVERRAARIGEVIDWIRRSLALNRAALFAALLALHDESIDVGLRSVCLLLDERERAAVQLQLAAEKAPSVASFLQDWQELIDSRPCPRLRSLQ